MFEMSTLQCVLVFYFSMYVLYNEFFSDVVYSVRFDMWCICCEM